ncbi:MAG: amylo-alpha-1,6-glucosidase [Gemmatimonadaceae bacterium]
MKRVGRAVFVSLVFTLPSPHALTGQGGYATPILAGISNRGQNKSEPYVTAGDRTYLIGTQDGNFPDMGGHVPGEMGGLWLHPIKLIDAFKATVTDIATKQEIALSESAEFVSLPYGSRFNYGPVLKGVRIERFEFSPDGHDGLIVEYRFTNTSAGRQRLQLEFSVKTDLLPVWSEHALIPDAPDSVTWQGTRGIFVARDTRNPWFCVWGAVSPADARRVNNPRPLRTRGSGVTAASRYTVAVDPGRTSTLTFVIAGSSTDETAAVEAFTYLARNYPRLLEKKKAHYAAIIDRARVRIPDKRLQDVYNWTKVNTEWLVRDVPGVGRGVGGGLMEYPWWFSDSYTVEAVTATGDFELAKQELRFLRDVSLKGNKNGRIIHEVTTNGTVSNPGNTQETAQYILAIGKVVDWTGDAAFAREMYPAMKQSLDWLLVDKDQNHDLLPEGYGIMEVLGLNAEVIDVAVYTQQALEATARVAAFLNQAAAAAEYHQLAARLKTKINDELWIEEDSSYADFYGTRAQAVSTAEGAAKQIVLKGEDQLTPRDRELIAYYERLKQKFAAMPDSSRGWITNENWVIATPMERGIAPRSKAIQLLDRIRRKNVGEYGPWLSAVEKQAMMTISTGVQAVAEGMYGRTDEAMWYVNRIAETFNRRTPGSISEMMPDYGCFVIAWTSYGIVIPLIQHVFGIQPNAIEKTVVFDPHLPTGWEDIAIEDLPIGTTMVSFSRTRTARGIEYDFAASDGGWNFILKGQDLPGARYYLNGSAISSDSSGIRMSGRKNHVVVIE